MATRKSQGPKHRFVDGAQTLGKSMGINQRPSPQGDDGALLASVCDEGVRVYDADHRYKVVQELEKVWGTMGDDGVMVEKFRQRI